MRWVVPLLLLSAAAFSYLGLETVDQQVVRWRTPVAPTRAPKPFVPPPPPVPPKVETVAPPELPVTLAPGSAKIPGLDVALPPPPPAKPK